MDSPEILEYKQRVRALAYKTAMYTDWCLDGLNEAMEKLGILPFSDEQTVTAFVECDLRPAVIVEGGPKWAFRAEYVLATADYCFSSSLKYRGLIEGWVTFPSVESDNPRSLYRELRGRVGSLPGLIDFRLTEVRDAPSRCGERELGLAVEN